jgi:hypothetical protein
MKKTIISLLLMAAFPVIAQTVVTAPSAPVIPNTVTVSPNAAAALAIATTNSVFIDQSGDNPNVNITQDGSGNKQGSAARPIYLRGIDQTIVTKQVGSSNEIMFEGKNNTTGAGQGMTVTIQQIGNTNTVDAACGYGNASDGSTALTGCKAADLNWKFTGNSNELQFRGTGDELKSAVTASGNLNKFYIDAIGDKHTQTLEVTGNSNEFNINQRSIGATGSSVEIHQTGDSTKYNVAQTGTINNLIYIKSVSNSGTFNITQKN